MKKIDFTKFPTVTKFAHFVCTYEGGSPNNLNMKNNNPGNIRCSNKSTMNHLAIACVNHFCQFKTLDDGWYALYEMFYNIATAKNKNSIYTVLAKKNFNLKDSSELTIRQMFSIYAPTSDGNNPHTYANWIAMQMAVNADAFQMKQLLV